MTVAETAPEVELYLLLIYAKAERKTGPGTKSGAQTLTENIKQTYRRH